MAPRVLMFGWEFPPHNSGGLGTACHGLTKALAADGAQITFVLPKRSEFDDKFLNFAFADIQNVEFKPVKTFLHPYITADHNYGRSLFEEVELYGQKAGAIAEEGEYDIIHAHDWLSFPAGIAAKQITGKPLVVHVHATEFDRTGGGGINEAVYKIEKQGMEQADCVMAVSERTKDTIIGKYGIDPSKVEVVYNGVDASLHQVSVSQLQKLRQRGNKIILFAGRITLQKGPDYFINLAKRILDLEPNVYFVVAGSGDMQYQVVRQSAELGVSDRVIFTGFVRGAELDALYQAADLYVLPSVSEPFGITPLESIVNGTPVLVSKQSGVAEVLNHALKTDFWDIDEMANQIIALLNYPAMRASLRVNSAHEVNGLTWDKSAEECGRIYKKVLAPAIV